MIVELCQKEKMLERQRTQATISSSDRTAVDLEGKRRDGLKYDYTDDLFCFSVRTNETQREKESVCAVEPKRESGS